MQVAAFGGEVQKRSGEHRYGFIRAFDVPCGAVVRESAWGEQVGV